MPKKQTRNMAKADPTCDYDNLIQEMKQAADELAALPEDQDYTMEATDRLESIRHEALRLKFEVEAIFDVITGRK